MNAKIILSTMAAAFCIATAYAQTPPEEQNPGPGQGQRQGGNFAQRKQEILEHLQQRLQNVQNEINCVQAANDHEALRACRPPRREGEGGMDHGEH